ncbi:MAG TPA: hypothetical protein VNN18_12545 [Candidatus Xenobia bacterium]|nr:hypothetical protein [Candidatus Xenobia bacterium]
MDTSGSDTGNNFSFSPKVSDNGRFVLFQSLANDLVPSDGNSSIDVFVRDTCIGAAPGCAPSTTRVSVTSNGTEIVADASGTSMSGDGRFVAFESPSFNIVPNDNNFKQDVFVRDTCQGAMGCTPSTVRVSLANGTEGDGNSLVASISGDGRFVAFQSDATNLVANDMNMSTDIFVTFNLALPAPAINPGGIVNAASFVGGSGVPLAPGSIVAVFGTNLAASTAIAGSVPLPTTLGGSTMTFTNVAGNPFSVPAPQFFASALQSNIQIPWEFQAQAIASVTDEISGVVSGGELIDFGSAAPGIFSTNQSGSGQGAILIANTPNLAAPTGMFPGSRPAVRGVDFLEIYCTGLGPVTNQPATGAAASANPLSATTSTPTVTIGGVNTPVLFSGLAPGFVGLYVITLQVPPNAPVGDAVPVVVTLGGVSNTVTIAIAAQ